MLKDVRFRYQHDDCWLQETTERYKDITLVISSVYMLEDDIHIDLMLHAPDPTIADLALRDWSRDPRVHKISKLYEGPRGTRFHVAYSSENSIYPDLIHHTPISIGTIRMAAGVEHYYIVGESEDITGLMKTLSAEGELTVESVRNLKEMPQGEAEEDPSVWSAMLTEKQWDALVLAHAHGYYMWPRVLSASQLASRVGLSSSAFLEHLRHAESRVLEAVVAKMKEADPARFDALRTRIQNLKPIVKKA
jgi:predicted DNA binding protein